MFGVKITNGSKAKGKDAHEIWKTTLFKLIRFSSKERHARKKERKGEIREDFFFRIGYNYIKFQCDTVHFLT